jgi:GPH family glycoside/pentoside/hexuronide:cation symporter
MLQSLSFPRMIAYCLGGPGWQITNTIVVNIGIYYYLPPEGSGLPSQLSEEIFLGVLTAYGLARLIGGVIDSLADPFVGYFSDTSRSRFGRRRAFMIYGTVPMVLTSALLFWPPGEPGSTTTFVFLSATLCAYYVFFTVYVGPYLALIPELARTDQERIDLSRMRALFGGLVMLAYGFLWLQGIQIGRDMGMTTEAALRWVVGISAVVALIFCLLPILAVDESSLETDTASHLDWRTSFRITIGNRPFLIYLFAQIGMILGSTMIWPALPYIARVMLGRDEGFAATMSLAFVPLITVGFAFVDRIANRVGTKNLLVASVALLGLSLIPLGLVKPDVPGGPNDARNLFIVFGALSVLGLPVACMMVLPMVILGRIIDVDAMKTGANRAAMFFGVQGLMTKWVFAASGAILSYLFSAYGRSFAEPNGVLLIGPVGGTICLFSAALYALYPEREVLDALAAGREAEALAQRAEPTAIEPAQGD